MVSNKGVIMSTTYNILREDKGISFGMCVLIDGVQQCSSSVTYSVFCLFTDLELYNEALKVIHDFPQHYPFEVAASG